MEECVGWGLRGGGREMGECESGEKEGGGHGFHGTSNR